MVEEKVEEEKEVEAMVTEVKEMTEVAKVKAEMAKVKAEVAKVKVEVAKVQTEADSADSGNPVVVATAVAKVAETARPT